MLLLFSYQIFLLPSSNLNLCVQGGSQRVSPKEKGVCEVFGEPRGCAGESEQDSYRGAQDIKGPVLCENWLVGHPSNYSNGTLLADLRVCLCAYTNTDRDFLFGKGNTFNPPVKCLFLYSSFLTNSLRTIDQKQQQQLRF